MPRYYVYTLAYPDGRVFYVGKGQRRRAYQHEHFARNGAYDDNREKQAIIQAILDAGEDVLTTIVARFESEEDALMYEWALIHCSTYAEDLTNKMPCLVKPALSFRPDSGGRKACFVQDLGRSTALWSRREVYFHDVKDLDAFCARHNINRRMMQRVLDGQQDGYKRFRIIRDCACVPS